MTHVSLPDVNIYVLKVVIEFLSTGEHKITLTVIACLIRCVNVLLLSSPLFSYFSGILKCYVGQEKEVKKVLVKVFGIPPKLLLSQVTLLEDLY